MVGTEAKCQCQHMSMLKLNVDQFYGIMLSKVARKIGAFPF